MPKIATNVTNTLDKVNEAIQGERQVILTTPEGIQTVLKVEADQAAKQGAGQAAKTAGKMEQEVAKETAQQVEKVVAKEAPDLAQDAPKFSPGKMEIDQKAGKNVTPKTDVSPEIKLILSNLRIEGENIEFNVQKPFDLILECADRKRWRG